MQIEISESLQNTNEIRGYTCKGDRDEENPIKRFNIEITRKDGKKYNQVFIGRVSCPNKPLILWFHGWLNNTNFFYDLPQQVQPLFNILFPQDRFGLNRGGSWHLGGNSPDSWAYPLITKAFIERLNTQLNFTDVILCGSSMGGYGALMNSVFYKDSICFTSVPQTNLDPTQYYFNSGSPETVVEASKYLVALGVISNENLINTLSRIPFLTKKNLLRTQFKRLRGKYPFLDLCTYNGKETTVELCGFQLRMKGHPRFSHITTTSFDNKHTDTAGYYFGDNVIPYCKNLLSNGILTSLKVLPIKGHDLYFYPNAVAHYYTYYLTDKGILEGKSFSYKSLLTDKVFIDSIPFI